MIEESVAYVTIPRDRLLSEFFSHKKDGEGGEDNQGGVEGGGEGIPELECTPDIPKRKYLKQKEV